MWMVAIFLSHFSKKLFSFFLMKFVAVPVDNDINIIFDGAFNYCFNFVLRPFFTIQETVFGAYSQRCPHHIATPVGGQPFNRFFVVKTRPPVVPAVTYS